jgi:hypothetical protein
LLLCWLFYGGGGSHIPNNLTWITKRTRKREEYRLEENKRIGVENTNNTIVRTRYEISWDEGGGGGTEEGERCHGGGVVEKRTSVGGGGEVVDMHSVISAARGG